VRGFQRLGNLAREWQRLRRRQGSGRDAIREGRALDQLQYQRT
jgi:hypothetical protein